MRVFRKMYGQPKGKKAIRDTILFIDHTTASIYSL